jgi:ergothioneine biosynthesis protein EgtB
MEDASPTKWHLAHTSWFFETFVLEDAVEAYEPFDRDYRSIFNSYYNSIGKPHDRPQRGLLTRPDLDTVLAYRKHVDEQLERAIDAGRLDEKSLSVVELGLHHEQQHQELILTDAHHLLSLNPLRPAYRTDLPVSPRRAASPLRWLRGPEGVHTIGHAGPDFAFDNESPRHEVFISPHELASRPATNGEYLEFMNDRGYEQHELWLSQGWGLAKSEAWKAPAYWELRDNEWWVFGLGGLRRLEVNEPVAHLSYYEASAFAQWSGARLPREHEWELAAKRPRDDDNFAESGWLQPLAAGHNAETTALQLFGDVWEWTASSYEPYPGFQPDPGALGEYNGKFMCNQYVLRGGSCATPRSHIRATYRNFFPPAARWQWSGVRLTRDA